MPLTPTRTLPGDAGTTPHLIVPFAVCNSDAWLKTVTAMPLAHARQTQALLRGMTRVAVDLRSEHSLSPPHERALAQALGLPFTDEGDGLIPWAAWEAVRSGLDARPGQGWAWVTPCHWAMGREHATLTDPAALGLSEAESRTLLAAMAPYFDTDGIRLHFLRADRWLAEGDVFCSLPTASLDRVLGRDVDPWLPKNKTLMRLQNEMQMLLYTHAVNDARGAARQWPVNSFWLSGSGALTEAVLDAARKRGRPSPPPSPLGTGEREQEAAASGAQLVDSRAGSDLLALALAGHPSPMPSPLGTGEREYEAAAGADLLALPLAGEGGGEGGARVAHPSPQRNSFESERGESIHLPRSLADSVFKNDWAGYAEAWAALDSGLISELLMHQRAGEAVRLTLCGERGFETWQSSPGNWRGWLPEWLLNLSVLAPQPLLNGHKQL